MKFTALFTTTCLIILMPSSSEGHENHTHPEADKSPEKPITRTATQWIKVGNALMQEARNTLSHDFSEAGAAYTQALKLEPENSDAMLGMAWVANSNHDFKAGKKWCEKVIAVSPKQVDAYSLMGDGAVEKGQYDEAFQHYQSALDIRVDLSTLSRSSHLVWITGNSMKARQLMMKAIKSGGPHPENTAWCRAELALMLLHDGAIPSAQKEAETAVLTAPKNPRALYAAAKVKIALKKYENAIVILERSLSIRKTHDAMATLVKLYGLVDNDEKKKAMTQQLIAFHQTGHQHADHHDHDHSHDHGHSHSDVGSSQFAKFLADENLDLDLALKQAELAYENFPNVYSADALAWCHFKKGDFKKATLYSRRSLAQQTPDASLHFHAGIIAEKSNQPSLARKHISAALSMNPMFDPVDAAEARAAMARIAASQKSEPAPKK
ncbi:hypothetical protein NT6N_14740 [Oceaniferula spumae]|uniref:Tetratricopeptide repeat protein n=1 Tax=Oceaniferula spumae TaxID=2979115 RepID=A0AAT9FKD5_9BACT